MTYLESAGALCQLAFHVFHGQPGNLQNPHLLCTCSQLLQGLAQASPALASTRLRQVTIDMVQNRLHSFVNWRWIWDEDGMCSFGPYWDVTPVSSALDPTSMSLWYRCVTSHLDWASNRSHRIKRRSHPNPKKSIWTSRKKKLGQQIGDPTKMGLGSSTSTGRWKAHDQIHRSPKQIRWCNWSWKVRQATWRNNSKDIIYSWKPRAPFLLWSV